MGKTDTKTKILEAGLKLFSEKGFLGTTTKEIARQAGVAELTLFRHFSSKEKLFEGIINTYSFLPALRGLLPKLKKMDYRDGLIEIATRFLERLSERRDLIRIMHAEIHLYPEQVKQIYHTFIDEIFRTLASYFQELQDKGVLRNFNAEIAAGAFLGMFFAYFNSKEFIVGTKWQSIGTKKVIEDFVDVFIHGTTK